MQPSELVSEEWRKPRFGYFDGVRFVEVPWNDPDALEYACKNYNCRWYGGEQDIELIKAVALDLYERGLRDAAEAAAATAEYLHGTNFLVAATGAETARAAILSKLRSAT